MTSFVVASGPIRWGSEEQGQDDVFGAPPPPSLQTDAGTDPWSSTSVSEQTPQIVQPSAEARAELEPELEAELEAEASRDASDVGTSDPQIFEAIELSTDEQHVEPADQHQSAANQKPGTQQHTAGYREPPQDMQHDEPINPQEGCVESEEAAEDGLCDAETTLEALPSQEMLSTHTSNPTFLNPTFEDIDSIDTDSESDGNNFSLSVNKLSGAVVKSTLGSSSGKTSASFEAGRRKLEEFKRKKQEAMAKRRFGQNPNEPPHAVATVKDREHEDNQQQTKSVVPRKGLAVYTAELEEMASKLSASDKAKEAAFQDLDRVLRQLEAVDAERSSLQREKAALVGEIIALKSSLETSKTQEGQVLDELRHEVDSERSLRQELANELSQLKIEHNAIVLELNKAREDVSNAHDNIESLKEMLAESDKERQKLESKLATESTESFGSDELQRRLAKAENAVEKERQAVSMLEKKLKEAESLAETGRTAVEREVEWQRRCNVAEAELARVQQQQQQQEPDYNQHLQQVANDLRAQCDAAARTISRLMEENQILTDRLNHHSNQQTVDTSSLSPHHQGSQGLDEPTAMNSLVEEKPSHAENRPRYSWWGWLAGADLAEGNRQ